MPPRTVRKPLRGNNVAAVPESLWRRNSSVWPWRPPAPAGIVMGPIGSQRYPVPG